MFKSCREPRTLDDSSSNIKAYAGICGWIFAWLFEFWLLSAFMTNFSFIFSVETFEWLSEKTMIPLVSIVEASGYVFGFTLFSIIILGLACGYACGNMLARAAWRRGYARSFAGGIILLIVASVFLVTRMA